MILHFGKYRGKQLENIPEGYLQWVLGNCWNISPRLRTAITSLVDGDATSTAISTDLACEWYRILAREFHPDTGGSHDGMIAINRARDLLLELVGGAK